MLRIGKFTETECTLVVVMFAVIFTFELSAYGHSSHAGSCDHMVLQKMNCEK